MKKTAHPASSPANPFSLTISALAAPVIVAAVSALVPASAVAQSTPGTVIGQMHGMIDGETVEFDIIVPQPGVEGGVMVDWYEMGGFTELAVAMFGLPADHPGRDGSTIEGEGGGSGVVMVDMFFESEGGGAPYAAASMDTLVDGGITVIDEWPEDGSEPTRAWLAELHDMDDFSLDDVALSEDDFVIAGALSTSRLCLFDERGFDLDPVIENGSHVCRDASLSFRVSGDTAASTAEAAAVPDDAPTEVEILGIIDGVLDGRAREWITIFTEEPRPSATAYWAEAQVGGPVEINLQGHDPESEQFLTEGVLVVRPEWLSQDDWSDSLGEEIRAEILYVVEASDNVPTLFYTSEDSPEASGAVQFATLAFDSPFGQADGRITGTLCRVERAGVGFETDPDDCLSLDAQFETEIRDGAAD